VKKIYMYVYVYKYLALTISLIECSAQVDYGFERGLILRIANSI
jgi:hypothetical protein